MSECPHPECKERLNKHITDTERTFFGRDKQSGVIGCLKAKMPKSWIWKFVTVFGIAIIIAGHTVFSGLQAAENITEQNAKQIAKNAEAIEKLQAIVHRNEVENTKINGKLDGILDSLKDIKNELKEKDN